MKIEDDSALPEGKVCADCVHWRRCNWLIGLDGNETECDWTPSRFKLREEATA